MGPAKQLISLPFSGGVDTKTDEKNVLPTNLTSLQNAIFLRTGAISKRWGYKALGTATYSVVGSLTGGNISAAKAINGSFNNELLLFDGSQAWTYSAEQEAWYPLGTRISSVIQSNKTIVSNTYMQSGADFGCVSTPDTSIDVWSYETGPANLNTEANRSVAVFVTDSTTGSQIVQEFLMPGTGPGNPKVIRAGVQGSHPQVNVIYSTAAGVTTGEINVAVVYMNPGVGVAFPSISTPITLQQLDVGSRVFYDACAAGDGSAKMYVIVRASDGHIGLYYFNASTSTIINSVNITGIIADQLGGLSVVSDSSGHVWVIYNDTTGSQSPSCSVAIYSADLTTRILAPNQVISQSYGVISSVAGIVDQSGLLNVYASVSASGAQANAIYSNTISLTGTLGVAAASAPVVKRGVSLASKPFMTSDGTIHVNAEMLSTLQSQYFTLTKTTTYDGFQNSVTSYPEEAVSLYGLALPLLCYIGSSLVPECVQTETNIFRWANGVRGTVTTQDGSVTGQYGVNATTLNFEQSNQFRSSSINGGLYTVGGILQSYDKRQYVEHGFLVYPEIISVTGSTTGGSLGIGTYWYVATYEWVDNNGNRQTSNVSPPIEVITSTATSSATIVIPTLRLTRKSNVQIHLYRTSANGLELNRVTSYTAPVLNNPAVDSVSITDTVSDAYAASSGALYTQPLILSPPQVIPNDAPPACSIIESYGDRLWLAGLDNPYQLWYSQQTIQGSPAQFSALLTLNMDADGGGITGLKRMDQELIIFKSNAIFYFTGQGPDSTGSNSDYQDPVQIPTGGVGCMNTASLVLTPDGIMFDSGQGIYLLNRAFNLIYIGSPVEGIYGTIGVIQSADFQPSQWVIFVTTSGTSLVYDIIYKQWSTFTNQVSVDGDVWIGDNQNHVFVNPNGQVYEQQEAYSDNGAPIITSLTTAWLDPRAAGAQGIGGYFRFYHLFLLGTWYGAHTLEVAAEADYVEAGFVPYPAIPVPSAPTEAYQYRIDVLYKGQSIRFTITDSFPGNVPSQGFALSQMSMIIGVKGGAMKLPASQQV